MMRTKRHLLTCYATALIPKTARQGGHASYLSTAAAFSNHHKNNAHHMHKFHKPTQIHAQCFGSRSFGNQFLKNTQTKSKVNDEDNTDTGNDIDDTNIENEYEEEEQEDYNYQPSNEDIKTISLNWIKKVVIGYNLCPFANQPLQENKLKVSVVRGNDDEYVAAAVVYELISRSDKQHDGTTVVVAPEFYPDDFHRYMSLIQLIEEDVMDEHDLHGLVQIAPFHPQFEFDGSGSDGVDNYTNRSPYPMFHILRENEVTNAVDKLGGDASKVWSRNIKLLESMNERWGREGTERAMKGEYIEGIDDLLKEVKLSTYRDKDDNDER